MKGNDISRGASASSRNGSGIKERLFRPDEALAAASTAAWWWQVGDPTITWTPRAAETLRLPEIVLKSPELLALGIDPDDLDLVSGVVERSGQSGEPLSVCLRVRVGQDVRRYDVAGRALIDEAGRLYGATGTALDATEQHEATEAVVAALDEAEAALDHLLAIVSRWDPNTGSLTVLRQPSALTLAVEVPDEVELSTLLARMDKEDGALFRDTLAMAAFDRRPFTIELRLRDDGHAPRRVLLRGRSRRTGDSFYIVGALLD